MEGMFDTMSKLKNYKPAVVFRILVICYSLILMVSYASTLSLWGDDLATIFFVEKGQSINVILNRIYSDIGSNPPLFYLVAFLWIRIIPFGTFFVKLLNIICCFLGIIFCGNTARHIKGDRAALIVTIFAATSFFLINYAAFSFRCYGFYFMVCSLLIRAYYNRLSRPKDLSAHIIYCIMLIVALYTHYFSIVIFGVLALYDLYLFGRRKISFNCAYGYIVAFLFFVPLLIIALKSMITVSTNFWAQIPTPSIFLETFELLFSNQKFTLLMFLTAIVVLCLCEEKQQLSSITNQAITALIVWVLFLFAFVYWFSRQEWLSSVFYSRYFVAALAPAIIVSGIGLDYILDLICINKPEAFSKTLVYIIICCCFANNAVEQFKVVDSFPGYVDQPIEQAIEYIYGNDISHLPNTLVISNMNNDHLNYYATHNGTRENLNFGALYSSNHMLYDNIVSFTLWGDLDEKTKAVLNEWLECTI